MEGDMEGGMNEYLVQYNCSKVVDYRGAMDTGE